MIHYHGGPLTPVSSAMRVWAARHAFISFQAPEQIEVAAEVAQSFALDNGAFSLWMAGKPTDWTAYYGWVAGWRTHPGFDFAVIPDVIGGGESENDDLAEQWPLPRHEGAPVWHTDESIDRLVRLADRWPRVCLGSSGEYDVARVERAVARLTDAIRAISDTTGRPRCKLHGLRMLNPRIFTRLPLASADSTNVARNIGIDKRWRGTYPPASKETRAYILAERIEAHNAPGEMPESTGGYQPHLFDAL